VKSEASEAFYRGNFSRRPLRRILIAYDLYLASATTMGTQYYIIRDMSIEIVSFVSGFINRNGFQVELRTVAIRFRGNKKNTCNDIAPSVCLGYIKFTIGDLNRKQTENR
jgi:hypothetical protein